MRKYIDIASTIPYFGMSFFEVKDESGTELLLGVAEDGVFFFNSQNLKLVHTLPYDVLSSWHLSDDGVDICFYENDEVHTISILTPPLKRTMIVALIDEYYALLPEKMKNDRVKPNNPKVRGVFSSYYIVRIISILPTKLQIHVSYNAPLTG